MSYFDAYVTTTGTSQLEVNIPALQKGESDHSFTDGEELDAALTVIGLMNDLENGQAIVITRTVF